MRWSEEEYIKRTKIRFLTKISENPETGCWIWIPKPHKAVGYGIFHFNRGNGDRTLYAHRASWLLFVEEIPEGMHVLHKCDIKLCVNPNHLFIGSHQDNMDDMNAKGRASNGWRPDLYYFGEGL